MSNSLGKIGKSVMRFRTLFVDLASPLGDTVNTMDQTIKIVLNGKPFDAMLVPIKASQERWNEYILEDGTTIRIKVVATEVYRVDELRNSDGDPVYQVKSNTVVSAIVPDELKKLPSGG